MFRIFDQSSDVPEGGAAPALRGDLTSCATGAEAAAKLISDFELDPAGSPYSGLDALNDLFGSWCWDRAGTSRIVEITGSGRLMAAKPKDFAYLLDALRAGQISAYHRIIQEDLGETALRKDVHHVTIVLGG